MKNIDSYLDFRTLGCNPDIRDVIPNPRDREYLSSLADEFDTEACPVNIQWLGDKRDKDGCFNSLMRRFQITRCDGDTLVITHIFNWIVDKKPPRIRCPGDINLGCNPVAIPAPDPEKLEVDDDCCLDTVFWLQDIIVSNTGCKQERLRQYGAIDCCSNRALCEQKITWISDMTPPEIIRCPEGKYLGCIPNFNVRRHLPKPMPGLVMAKDECSNVKITVEISDITVIGCEYSISYIYIATDRCGNQSQCLQTFTWTSDNEPPIVEYEDLFLGCNPDPADIPSIDDIAISDNCGEVTISNPASSISQDGCVTVITQSFTVMDACGNETKCERRIWYITDSIPPEIDCSDLDLGCNPDYIPTVFDFPVKGNCGGVEIINPVSSISQDGCKFTTTQSITAVDRCGNRSTCSRTITYIKDTIPPVVQRCNRTIDLGCIASKDEVPPPLPAHIVITDDCGEVDVEVIDKKLEEGRCQGKLTYYYKISDQCGNMKRCRITYTWVQDTLPPLVDCPEEVFLGCNPTSLPGLDASRIKVKDNCGIADTLYAIVDYFPDGCLYKVGYSYTFIDHCGNQTSCLEVLSWTIDNQPPTIVQCPVDVDLGCWDQDGPNDLPPPDMDAFVVDDACGEVTITYQDGFDIVINPAYCTATRVRRYIATDACGNETECWQSFTWTYDVSPPPIIQCAPDLDLGCIDDLDEVPGPYNPDDIIALDNCTNITKSWIDGEALIDGCEWEYRYRYRVEDECGNESMCIQSIQFTYIDPQAPTLEIPEDLTVFCTVPPTPDYSGVCANESLELLFEFDTGCDDNNCIVYRYWLLTTCEGKQVFGVQQINVECNITGQLAEDSGPERSDNSVKTISGYLSDSINPGKIISNYSTDPYKTATGVLKVYPNPATNVMNLTLEDVEMPHEQGQALIYDQYGRVVLQQVIGDRIENYPIRLVDLPSGMYYLEVISADK